MSNQTERQLTIEDAFKQKQAGAKREILKRLKLPKWQRAMIRGLYEFMGVNFGYLLTSALKMGEYLAVSESTAYKALSQLRQADLITTETHITRRGHETESRLRVEINWPLLIDTLDEFDQRHVLAEMGVDVEPEATAIAESRDGVLQPVESHSNPRRATPTRGESLQPVESNSSRRKRTSITPPHKTPETTPQETPTPTRVRQSRAVVTNGELQSVAGDGGGVLGLCSQLDRDEPEKWGAVIGKLKRSGVVYIDQALAGAIGNGCGPSKVSRLLDEFYSRPGAEQWRLKKLLQNLRPETVVTESSMWPKPTVKDAEQAKVEAEIELATLLAFEDEFNQLTPRERFEICKAGLAGKRGGPGFLEIAHHKLKSDTARTRDSVLDCDRTAIHVLREFAARRELQPNPLPR